MRLSDLRPAPKSKKKPKRLGRGESSGTGKTAGRGHKGQKARSGGGVGVGFEGGQMPLQRRLPKRGFTNIFKKTFAVVNLKDLEGFPPDSLIDSEVLATSGLIRGATLPVKVLANGDLTKPLNLKVQAASKKALEKITALGGRVEILTL
ncbi:MAG: 50S ribosomal protein L15 [Deltaproteobacteria bacterium]|jgi:large subunit ribosomal protein L15|nr:50S ribosomal protein L15 [Deltaproteobacteria bacterium]